MLQEGLLALCATAAVITMRDLLNWLNRNLPRFFAEQAAVTVMAAMAIELGRQLYQAFVEAVLLGFALTVGAVIAFFAIEAIAAVGVIAEIVAAIKCSNRRDHRGHPGAGPVGRRPAGPHAR